MIGVTCLCTLDEALDGHRHHCPVHKGLYPDCSECEMDREEAERDAELFDKEEEN